MDVAGANAILASRSDIAYYYSRAYYRGVRPGDPAELGFMIRTLDGNWQPAGYDVPEGRMLAGPGEAIAGRALRVIGAAWRASAIQ